VRVTIVGCGAVGSLFAANLAQLDDVEVWAFDLDREHVAAMNEHGLRLSGAGEIVGKLSATTDAAKLPPSDFGIVATKCMHTAAAIEATAGAFANGSVCSVQNGVGNEETLAQHVERVIRGTTFPAGRVVEPATCSGTSRATRRSGHSSRAGAHGRRRAARRRLHARRHADSRGRRRARPPMAQADLQRGDEPDRRADGAHARPRRRGRRAAATRLPASSTRAGRSRRRRRSSSTPTPRS